MEIAYKQADANLERKYRADCESLRMQRDNKLIAAQHASERAMKSVLRRREKLSSESTKLSSIESRGVEIRGQKIPQFKKDSNLPFVDLNAPPRLPIQKIRITREKKNSDTTSRSSLSSTRRKYSGSQRTNRSPSRLGQVYH